MCEVYITSYILHIVDMKNEFKKIKSQNNNLSSLICFIKLIQFNKYKKGEIRKGFNELVLKGDYFIEDRDEILDFILNHA